MARDKKPKRLTKRVRGWIGDTITGGKKDQTVTQSINQSNNQDISVDLSSTLAKFSLPTFHAESFVNTHFICHSINQTNHLSNELIARKNQTRVELQSYVSAHHEAFIETSNNILSIESDMVTSCTLLQSINQSINQLIAPSFKYQDEKMFLRSNEQENKTRAQIEAQQSINQSINEWNECLRSYIYERRFEEAVEIIETADQSINQSINQTSNLSERRSQLIDTLCAELSTPNLSKSDRRRLIDWLIRCNAIDQARSIYLSINQSMLKSEIKHLVLGGSLIDYVRQLASVTVHCLAETTSEAAKLFSQSINQSNNPSGKQSNNQSNNQFQSHSAVIVWCEEQISQFCSMVSRQVFLPDQSFEAINQSIECIFECFETMNQCGFSCSHLLELHLAPHIVKSIEAHFDSSIEDLKQSLADEKWQSEDLVMRVANRSKQSNKPSKATIWLTPSAYLLYRFTREFLITLQPFFSSPLASSFYQTINPIIHQSIHQSLTGCLIELVQVYLIELASRARTGMTDGTLDDEQALAIVANVYYLIEDLLERITTKFHTKYRLMNDPSLQMLGQQMGQLYDQLLDHYVMCRAQQFVDHVIEWPSMMKIEYANPHDISIKQSKKQSNNQTINPSTSTLRKQLGHDPALKVLGVSISWLRLHERCVRMRDVASQLLPSVAVPALMSAICEELLQNLIQQTCFDEQNDDDTSAFGWGGCMQFTRDLTFFVTAMRDYASPDVIELKDELIDLARMNYVRSTGANDEEASAMQDTHVNDVEALVEERGHELLMMHTIVQRDHDEE